MGMFVLGASSSLATRLRSSAWKTQHLPTAREGQEEGSWPVGSVCRRPISKSIHLNKQRNGEVRCNCHLVMLPCRARDAYRRWALIERPIGVYATDIRDPSLRPLTRDQVRGDHDVATLGVQFLRPCWGTSPTPCIPLRGKRACLNQCCWPTRLRALEIMMNTGAVRYVLHEGDGGVQLGARTGAWLRQNGWMGLIFRF